MARCPNIRAIKQNRTYTLSEAARTVDTAPITVRRWRKAGLLALIDRKPALILGADLIDFLTARKPARQKCRPHECYCFKCRAPREPAFAEVEIVSINASSANMRALCEVCTSVIHKRVRLSALPALETEFGLTVSLVCERIDENG